MIVAVALGGWNIVLNDELSSAQAYRSGVEQALDLAAQPGSVTALIRADDGSSSGFGVIGADGTVKLAMRGMAATTGSQVYTAWSIAEGSAPVSMGDFSVGSDGIALATAHAPAAAPGLVMAITLEPNAGNTAPQGPVVASGVTRDPRARSSARPPPRGRVVRLLQRLRRSARRPLPRSWRCRLRPPARPAPRRGATRRLARPAETARSRR